MCSENQRYFKKIQEYWEQLESIYFRSPVHGSVIRVTKPCALSSNSATTWGLFIAAGQYLKVSHECALVMVRGIHGELSFIIRDSFEKWFKAQKWWCEDQIMWVQAPGGPNYRRFVNPGHFLELLQTDVHTPLLNIDLLILDSLSHA